MEIRNGVGGHLR